MRGKKLMVLGAGPFQVPVIREAAQCGCHVVTVDYLTGNVGHKYSHESVNLSTVDQEAVLKQASDMRVDGIMTMASDVAVPTVAFVADALNLPGPTVDQADTFTNKLRFREFQARHGLSHPYYDFAATAQEIDWQPFASIEEVVIKPPDTSGSRGVNRVKTNDIVRRQWAFDEARRFSRSGQVCVDEYVEGFDVTGEGFMFAGDDPVIAFTQKFTRECLVYGHRLPGILNKRQKELATEVLLKAFAATGYREGPFDADLRVTNERAVILEMSPRLGGNGCPLLLRAYTGLDPVNLAVRQALDERLQRPELELPGQGYGSIIIGSDRGGILQSHESMEQMQRALPYIEHGVWAVQPGDRVEKFEHGGNTLGLIIFKSDSCDDYRDRAEEIRRVAGIQVSPQA